MALAGRAAFGEFPAVGMYARESRAGLPSGPKVRNRSADLRNMQCAPRNPRYSSLDMWRGVACLMVVVFHSTMDVWVLQRGLAHDFAWYLAAVARRLWIGVPIFFVISGYCISATADATRLKKKSTRNYFWRRFRRIFPPYWAALAAYAAAIAIAISLLGLRPPAILNGQVYPPFTVGLRHWIENLSLTAVWSYRLLRTDHLVFLGQAWSLCYEEIFYATMGILLWVARRHLFRWLAVITGAGVAGIAAMWLRPGGVVTPHLVYWTCFASGVLVFYTLNYASSRRPALALLSLGLIAAASRPSSLRQESANPSQFAFAAFSFAILLILTHGADRLIMSWRWTRPLQHCGTLCYSLYLVHWPAVGVVSVALYGLGVRTPALTLLITVPVCLAVSLAIAELFHRNIERRFLNAPLAGSVERREPVAGQNPAPALPHGPQKETGAVAGIAAAPETSAVAWAARSTS
jgi:peptidoglycan/LPS O-acetylase OafA/YrhL